MFQICQNDKRGCAAMPPSLCIFMVDAIVLAFDCFSYPTRCAHRHRAALSLNTYARIHDVACHEKPRRSGVLKRGSGSGEPWRLDSAHAPNATGDLHQGSHDGGAGEEPGEGGTAATAEPEAAGELSPAGLGEQVGGRVVDGGVSGLHVRPVAGSSVDGEANGQDGNQADGGQQPCGACVLGET